MRVKHEHFPSWHLHYQNKSGLAEFSALGMWLTAAVCYFHYLITTYGYAYKVVMCYFYTKHRLETE